MYEKYFNYTYTENALRDVFVSPAVYDFFAYQC